MPRKKLMFPSDVSPIVASSMTYRAATNHLAEAVLGMKHKEVQHSQFPSRDYKKVVKDVRNKMETEQCKQRKLKKKIQKLKKKLKRRS